MAYLDSLFKLWLLMLENLVRDETLGSIFWVFILAMSLFITIRFFRGMASWKF